MTILPCFFLTNTMYFFLLSSLQGTWGKLLWCFNSCVLIKLPSHRVINAVLVLLATWGILLSFYPCISLAIPPFLSITHWRAFHPEPYLFLLQTDFMSHCDSLFITFFKSPYPWVSATGVGWYSYPTLEKANQDSSFFKGKVREWNELVLLPFKSCVSTML